jgi:hypothetical protein
MQIPVVVETLASGQFRAQGLPPFTAVAEGPTSDAALASLREALEKELQNGKQVVMMEIPGGQAQPHPWLAMAGWLKDDPLVDEWRAVMREYRDQVNREEGIERE